MKNKIISLGLFIVLCVGNSTHANWGRGAFWGGASGAALGGAIGGGRGAGIGAATGLAVGAMAGAASDRGGNSVSPSTKELNKLYDKKDNYNEKIQKNKTKLAGTTSQKNIDKYQARIDKDQRLLDDINNQITNLEPQRVAPAQRDQYQNQENQGYQKKAFEPQRPQGYRRTQ